MTTHAPQGTFDFEPDERSKAMERACAVGTVRVTGGRAVVPAPRDGDTPVIGSVWRGKLTHGAAAPDTFDCAFPGDTTARVEPVAAKTPNLELARRTSFAGRSAGREQRRGQAVRGRVQVVRREEREERRVGHGVPYTATQSGEEPPALG